MFYNDIFNIIILLTFIMLAMNIKILESIPTIMQYPRGGLYDRKQTFYDKEKIFPNKRNTNSEPYFMVHPKHKRLLSLEEQQQKEYERKVNKIKNDLLAGEKLFDSGRQSFDKWWLQNDDNNEIFHNFLNNVNQSWSYQKNSKDEEEEEEDAAINSYKNNYNEQHRHSRYNYNDLNLFDEEHNEDLDILSYLTPKPPYELKTQIHRREAVPTNDENKQIGSSSLYPSVLTKAVEISLNPSISPKAGGGSLLENVAQKMNTSALDLASKLAKSPDIVDSNGHFAEIVQGLMKNNAILNHNFTVNRNSACALQNAPRNIEVRGNFADENLEASLKSSGLGTILERILNKLDTIHDTNDKGDDENPDGAPCDVMGTWSSSTLGLCFDIQSNDDKIRDISPAEINNKILLINCKECTPAKHHHQLFDLQWKFKGSALKQLGGPLYMYGQKRSENVAATFLGFCRTCGGIDTIFGSWNILSPSKDCNDISLAFEVKRDVLRRSLMEKKRKERIKNVLYQSRLG